MPTDPVVPDPAILPRLPLEYAPVAKGRRLRRWGRRLLIALIVVATVALSWYGWQWRLKQDEKEFNARATIHAPSGTVEFIAPPTVGALRHLQRLSNIHALDFFCLGNPNPTAYLLFRGRRFPTITSFEFAGDMDADVWVKELARPDTGFKAVTNLDLSFRIVTDAGLKELSRPDSGLKALTTLNLCGTHVTDADLKELSRPDSGLKALTTLDLSQTQLTDAGLKELTRPDTGLKSLAELTLISTRVTHAGIAALRAARPGLIIAGYSGE